MVLTCLRDAYDELKPLTFVYNLIALCELLITARMVLPGGCWFVMVSSHWGSASTRAVQRFQLVKVGIDGLCCMGWVPEPLTFGIGQRIHGPAGSKSTKNRTLSMYLL